MTALDAKLQDLKDQTIETMYLVRTQLIKSKEAFMGMDMNIAQEVYHYEKRVNALDLTIDKACERIIAQFHPMGTDLRFVIASLKIIGHLERLGDHSYGIAKYVPLLKTPFSEEILEAVHFREMYDVAISMIDDAIHAFNFEETSLARNLFSKDGRLDAYSHQASLIIANFITKYPEETERLLHLFSTIRKLERMGDLSKNVAEETIFFIEAKVLKHQKNE